MLSFFFINIYILYILQKDDSQSPRVVLALSLDSLFYLSNIIYLEADQISNQNICFSEA